MTQYIKLVWMNGQQTLCELLTVQNNAYIVRDEGMHEGHIPLHNVMVVWYLSKDEYDDMLAASKVPQQKKLITPM